SRKLCNRLSSRKGTTWQAVGRRWDRAQGGIESRKAVPYSGTRPRSNPAPARHRTKEPRFRPDEAPMTSTGQLRQQVNGKIIQALEQGGVPWRSDHGFPKNVLSRRRYGGVEAICPRTAGCPSPYWGTNSEWEALGGASSGRMAMSFAAWGMPVCRLA